MIDEVVLEQLLGELAEEIAVPADGAARVVHELSTSGRATRFAVPRRGRLAMAAAAAVVVVGLGVVVNNATKSSTTKVSSARDAQRRGGRRRAAKSTVPARARQAPTPSNGNTRVEGCAGHDRIAGSRRPGRPPGWHRQSRSAGRAGRRRESSASRSVGRRRARRPAGPVGLPGPIGAAGAQPVTNGDHEHRVR